MIEELRNLLVKGTQNIDGMRKFIQQHVLYATRVVSKPCGVYLISKNIYQEMINKTGFTEEEFKNYLVKQFEQQKIKLNQTNLGYVTTNPLYNLLLVYIFVFLANNEYDSARQASRLYGYFTLSYMKRKYFKICNADTLLYTINNLHGHSIVRSDGLIGLVTKICDETLKKYETLFLKEINVYNNYRYLVDVRNKLNQSMKIIATKYYKNMEEKATESLIDRANEIMEDFVSVSSSPNIINYISQLSLLSTLEIESLFFDIQQTPEAQNILTDIIIKLLYKYGGEEKISTTGIEGILGKAQRNEEFVNMVSTLYESCGYEDEITKNHVLAIIGLALILIVWKR
jgi:hypothetical protein